MTTTGDECLPGDYRRLSEARAHFYFGEDSRNKKIRRDLQKWLNRISRNPILGQTVEATYLGGYTLALQKGHAIEATIILAYQCCSCREKDGKWSWKTMEPEKKNLDNNQGDPFGWGYHAHEQDILERDIQRWSKELERKAKHNCEWERKGANTP